MTAHDSPRTAAPRRVRDGGRVSRQFASVQATRRRLQSCELVDRIGRKELPQSRQRQDGFNKWKSLQRAKSVETPAGQSAGR